MTWFNEWEIDQAREDCAGHPLLGPATRTLSNLRDVVNANSDGWPYWKAPARAAEKLMRLIEGDRAAGRDPQRSDVTEAALKAAYTPIRAFLTKQGLTCEIVTPETVAADARMREAEAVWRAEAEAKITTQDQGSTVMVLVDDNVVARFDCFAAVVTVAEVEAAAQEYAQKLRENYLRLARGSRP